MATLASCLPGVGLVVLASTLARPGLAQDPNLDWYNRNVKPHAEAVAKTVHQYHEARLAEMDEEQQQFHAACVAQGVAFDTCVQIASLAPNLRQGYVECLSVGGTADNCMFAANLNQGMQQFQEELAALQRLVPACDAGNAQACAQADAIIDAQRKRAYAASMMAQQQTFQGRQSHSIRRQELDLQYRETASALRMTGWQYDRAARDADAAGDRDAATAYRNEARKAYDAAEQYEPRR